MAIKAEIKSTIKFPDEYITQDDLMHVAEQIFIPMMQKGIDAGIDVEGNPFPPNAEATIKRKGHRMVLIETGRLRRSFWAKPSGKTIVHVKLEGDRIDIGGYLQLDGIRTKSGKNFYKFFGITDGMEMDAMDYAKKRIAEVCKKFNGG
jgi:hypothetical protein